MHTLVDLSRKLASGTLSSRALTEACLDRIADPNGEGARAFLTLYRERALAEAERVDQARAKGWNLPPYAGIAISIKDLFDVAGETTRAGSHVLDREPPARADATVVEFLRRAGLIVLGKTNMTEFAYSGLGINGHFGTPLNPFERDQQRIPGGSTSGGAVSVGDRMAQATIGTDTGGSCRIPAALCGIVGFKPTSTRISQRGVIPLSTSLDSVGPLAHSVSCCAVLDSILAGGWGEDEDSFRIASVRLGVIDGYVTDHVDRHVGRCYEEALTRLSRRGANLTPIKIDELSELPAVNRSGGLVGAEAYAWHRRFLETRGEYYDPWVRARFEAGKAQTAADYIDVLNHRRRIQTAFESKTYVFDALVLPTVQIIAPTIDSLSDQDHSNAVNLLCLRNTSIGNFLDRPAISVPCHTPGEAPVGLMLMGRTNGDRRLLSIARSLEYAIRPS